MLTSEASESSVGDSTRASTTVLSRTVAEESANDWSHWMPASRSAPDHTARSTASGLLATELSRRARDDRPMLPESTHPPLAVEERRSDERRPETVLARLVISWPTPRGDSPMMTGRAPTLPPGRTVKSTTFSCSVMAPIGGAKRRPRCRDAQTAGKVASAGPSALRTTRGPCRCVMPRAASCWARSASWGPCRVARSSDRSPFISKAQVPSQSPVVGSTMPVPTTRVARRALPPSVLRANPVVKSLTVEAGRSGWSSATLQKMRPVWSAIAMPHWPGARRLARLYQESRARCTSASLCALATAGNTDRPPTRATRPSTARRTERGARERVTGIPPG